MILGSFLLYSLILVVARLSGVLLLFDPPWYFYIVIFAISVLIVRFFFAFIRSFQEEYIPLVMDCCNNKGLRRYILGYLIAILIFTIALILKDEINRYNTALLIPLGLTTILSFLKIDYLPLQNEVENEESSYLLPKEFTPEYLKDIDNEIPNQEDGIKSYQFEKNFSWVYNNYGYSIALKIRPHIYDKYQSKKRVDYNRWAQEYVTNGVCGETRLLTQKLLEIGKPQNSYMEVEFVLAFIQSIVKYEKDAPDNPKSIVAAEYPKYPVETIVEETGDCEDTAILGAALLKTMGYDSALVFLPGHCALGIAGADDMPGSFVEHENKKYFYCETTAAGWKIGELPEDYEYVNVKVYPVPSPAVSLEN